MISKIWPVCPSARPVFSMLFPYRLKFQYLGNQNAHRGLILTRCRAQSRAALGTSDFSTRSGRERKGSSFGNDVRPGSSKSLIEDEADLSDWVSGLSSNSFKKTRMHSDSEEDDNVESRGSRGRDRSGKRRRESDFDKDLDLTRRRRDGSRSSSDFEFPGKQGEGSRTREPFSGRRDEGSRTREPFSGRGKTDNEFETSYGGRDRVGKFGGRSEGSRTREPSSGRRGEGSRMREPSSGKRGEGSRTREPFSGRGKTDNEFETSYGGRDRVGRFGGSLEEKRGGGNSGFLRRGYEDRMEKRQNGSGREMQYGKGRDGGGDRGNLGREREGSAMGRRGLLVSDDDEVEKEDDEEEVEEEEEYKGFKSFKELIDSDGDDDDEDDEGEEVEVVEEGGGGLFEKGSFTPKSSQATPGGSASYLSESRFDQCSISPLTLKAINDAGYEKMTLVQEATLPLILKGKDVLAKAKTGTGKTVAFLLPSIELVAKSPPIGRDQKRPPIFVLVICPTRELATQAATEANTLLKYHPSIGVQVVIGGTRLALEQKRMQANPCQILVATPGRLRDHIENTAGFATRLMGVKVLVLDEADHLLDMGFRKEIEKIIAAVPKQRQTLLFSATIPQEVRQISLIALKRDHEFVNTVEEGSEDTHSQVQQMHMVAPLDKHFPLLYSLLKEHIADDVNYKILVFCTTAMVTRLVAELLGELNLNVREIHSRKPQSYRTRISDEFRKSKGLILVTSDVSARGVDYPDVTLVVQMGVPSDRQQYIHRLGRTGRKGKEGQGILLLAPWEEFFLSNIKDLPISKSPEPLVDQDTQKKVQRSLSHVEMKNKEAAYQAWLGYYNSNKNIGRDKNRLVELANEFSRCMGLDNPPAIAKLVLGKMGLKNVPGLRSK